MKKLLFLLVAIFLSIASFGQLKQVEVPDTTAKDTVYVEQKSTIIYNYYDTQDSWYNYSPFRFNWYVDWYTPYYYNWYSPYYYNWYSPYNYNWYGWYSPYYHYNYTHYNHYGHNSHYNTNYYGHRNVSSGYRAVNQNNRSSYQYKKPIEHKPLYDHSQRRSIVPKYNESRPTPKYDVRTRVRQNIDMNPDNTRYRTPQYKPNRPADNPRPQMDRPQQRSYSPQPSSRPAPTHTNTTPQRSYSPQPSNRPAPSSGGSRPSGGSYSGGGHRK
jgi:hypothetical protein